jgi:hypothetical protein
MVKAWAARSQGSASVVRVGYLANCQMTQQKGQKKIPCEQLPQRQFSKEKAFYWKSFHEKGDFSTE